MTPEDCIPANKHDVAAIRRAEVIGFPAVNPILGELLRWVQDINWPVAPHAATFLRGAGPEIAPHITDVLNGDDDIWKSWVLWEIAGHLRPDVWSTIARDVARIAGTPTSSEVAEGADEAATRAIGMQSGPGATG